MVYREAGDIGAGDFAAMSASQVGNGPHVPASRLVVAGDGSDDDPVKRAGADGVFLAVFVLVDVAEEQWEKQPVMEEAAVAVALAVRSVSGLTPPLMPTGEI